MYLERISHLHVAYRSICGQDQNEIEYLCLRADQWIKDELRTKSADKQFFIFSKKKKKNEKKEAFPLF